MKKLFLLWLIAGEACSQPNPFPRNLSPYQSSPYSLGGRTNMIGIGDSFMYGLNASITANCFISLFATNNNQTLTNSGQSGRGVWVETQTINASTFIRSNTTIVSEGGLNDMKRSSLGGFTQTLAKINACKRSTILRAISGAAYPSGSASVTRTGSPTTFNAQTYGGIFPTGTLPGQFASASTATGNETWSWTFSGTQFGVNFIASDGVVQQYGTALIFVDNVLTKTVSLNYVMDGISDGANDNKHGSYGITIHGLSNASHTIKVQANGDGIVAIDYFCTLLTPGQCAAVMFTEIPYLNSIGYATAPSYGSTVISDQVSQLIKGIVREYYLLGFPIYFVPLNLGNGGLYDLSTGVSSIDNVHPNDTGHNQIYLSLNQALTSHLPTLFSAFTTGNGSNIVLLYDVTLGSTTPSNGDFSLSGGKTVTGVSISGQEVILTLSGSYISSDVITLNYTPGTNKIQDGSGKFAVALSSQSVRNFVQTNTTSFTAAASNQIAISGTNPVNLGFSNGTTDNINGFSIVYWHKYTNASNGYQRNVTLGDVSGHFIYEFRTNNGAGNNYYLGSILTNSSNYKASITASALTQSTWRQLIITYSPTNGFTFYINGVVTSFTPNNFGNYTAMPAVSTSYKFSVGGGTDASLTATGTLIDDLYIINEELTQTQIYEAYANGTSSNLLNCTFASNIMQCMKFENNLNDSSGNGYTLTSTAGPTYNTDHP